MPTTNPEDYVAVLHHWLSWADAQGFPAPEPQRVVEISRDPQRWAQGSLTPVEAGWRGTIDHLLTQTTLGVRPELAVAHLPDRLRRAPDLPAEAPPATTSDSADDDPEAALLRALFDWRTKQIAQGTEGADGVKDVTLRRLVRHKTTRAEQIQGRLTGPGAPNLAAQIAAVIARFHGTNDTSDTVATAPERASDSPSTAPRHRQATPTSPPAPPSTPSPTTTPAGPIPTSRSWTHADFVAFDFSEADVEPGRIAVAPDGDGVRLTWEPYSAAPGDIVLYRVVASDEIAPYKPESGELLDVTTTTSVTDGRFPTSAIRFYQVWVHVGPDEESATGRQAVQWAVGEEVSPVDNMVLSEESGRVIGEWDVFPNTRTVRIFRIPLDGGAPPISNPSNQILTDQANLAGFVDAHVPRGKRFLYSVQAEVVVNESARLSRPLKQDILVSVDLVPVTDLTVTMDESNTTFNLSWTTPTQGQQVRIHRFDAPPPAGLQNEDRDESAITVAGFTEENRIKNPVTALDPTTSQITGVLWPSSWERAYLTPVTASNGRVRIGTTAVHTRPLPPVTEPRIVERFNTELITFGWPSGAAAVQVFVGHATLSAEQICAQAPFAEVTVSAHRRDGAIILPQPFPANGCTVCLVPIAYSRGEQIRGEVTTLSYPGLDRLRYWFDPVETPNPASRVLRLVMHSPNELLDPPALVLVANQQRLPLDSRDGQHLQFDVRGQRLPHCDLPRIPQGTHPTDFTVDLGTTYAYIRLFVHEAQEGHRALALHDPEMYQLYQFTPPPPPGAPS